MTRTRISCDSFKEKRASDLTRGGELLRFVNLLRQHTAQSWIAQGGNSQIMDPVYLVIIITEINKSWKYKYDGKKDKKKTVTTRKGRRSTHCNETFLVSYARTVSSGKQRSTSSKNLIINIKTSNLCKSWSSSSNIWKHTFCLKQVLDGYRYRSESLSANVTSPSEIKDGLSKYVT